ncbi:hypothetical protein L1987_54611 [Smallanthus sonchifolius]|uniref:Uncharacterized protein n=1 Tax=Smallanthus sonchifolius TaxID=185202 RepID=A0ACB9E827_9ASTR|nr:hypothetical protein L1987_54611 [Smallanthus sonchifolius]
MNVDRSVSPLEFWDVDLLQEREAREINSGGFGSVKLLGMYVSIDRNCDDRDDLKGLFKENPIILEENKVRGSTHEAECSKKVSGSNDSDIDETIMEICKQVETIVKTRENDKEEQPVDRVAGYDGGHGQDVDHFFNKKKMEGIDNSFDFEAPSYSIGLTQDETLENKRIDNFDFDAPSYSIGLTQDETPGHGQDVVNDVNKKQMEGIDNNFDFDAPNYRIDLTQDETPAELLDETKVIRKNPIRKKITAKDCKSPFVKREVGMNNKVTKEEETVWALMFRELEK